MKINRNLAGFGIIAVIVILFAVFVLGRRNADPEITKERTENLSVELYKLAKPETETVKGFKKRLRELSDNYSKADVETARKFIREQGKDFTESFEDCDDCVISVEIDELTALDENSYDIHIRLVNTHDDMVKSELPVRLLVKYGTNGISVLTQADDNPEYTKQ